MRNNYDAADAKTIQNTWKYEYALWIHMNYGSFCASFMQKKKHLLYVRKKHMLFLTLVRHDIHRAVFQKKWMKEKKNNTKRLKSPSPGLQSVITIINNYIM